MSKKKLIAIALCILAVATVIFVFRRSDAQVKQSKNSTPKHEVYELMFRHYVALKNQAAKAEQEGKDGQALRNVYKEKAKLSEQEDALLDEVATDCVSKISALEGRAKQVIAEARARVPGGRLKEGEAPPPAPDELSVLQQERESVVQQGYEKLRAGFGASEFARFDEFVQQKIGASMKGVKPLDVHHPKLQQGPKR